MTVKKWQILGKGESVKGKGLRLEQIISVLLHNRGLKTKKEVDAFLHADLSSVTSKSVGIDEKQLAKALKRIQKAIDAKEQIVVYGDYDVDGITATAIVWETLHALGGVALPYIPSRLEEGYGLSKAGISNIQSKIPNVALIITVDNGIVASEAVDFANKAGIDVIITDHHTVGEKLPEAFAIIHTTQVCGAGVAWLLSQEIEGHQSLVSSHQQATKDQRPKTNDHLSLVALATVADLVPLTGANRTLLRFGLPELRQTKRPGLLALYSEAEIDPQNIGVYEIGHGIGPRLNAMGRLESAMDSLRLLCTKDKLKAKVLADTLGRTNKERQLRTQSAALHAIEHFRFKSQDSGLKRKLLFIAHDEYEEGIIGLVAGKLVEEYYVPAIVLSKGEKISKASARSVAGFNIIDFIRTHTDLLINAGGHPMAAGFTIETQNILALQEALEELAEKQVDGDMLQRVLRIDCPLPLEMVTAQLYTALQKLAPFGMGNPEPTFVSTAVVQEIKTVGKEAKHLKMKVAPASLRGVHDKAISKQDRHASLAMTSTTLDAIAFGLGEKAKELKPGDAIDIVYTINENVWNGRVNLQLKIKDMKLIN